MSKISTISDEVFVNKGKDTTKLHLVVDARRIGASLFNTKLEYTHFAPRSGKNYLFEMIVSKWPEGSSLIWCITSIPIEFKPQAEAIAAECGLRLADGFPTFIDKVGAQHFPMNGPTVFTLENTAGHQIYKNDLKDYKKLCEAEFAEVDRIVEADRQKLKQEFRSQGYAEDQIDRILEHWLDGNEDYNEIPRNGTN